MFGMTAWEQTALMIIGWGVVQLALLLVWARFARREEERRREVIRCFSKTPFRNRTPA